MARPPTAPDSDSVHVQDGGTHQTVDLSQGEAFIARVGGRLRIDRQRAPESLAALRRSEHGIEVHPLAPGSRLNGAPLERPGLLGKFDLLEVAGALLRSDDSDANETRTLPPGTQPQATPHTPGSGVARPQLTQGSRIAGRYELRRKLGEGGFGAVFEAWDLQLGRAVAIKVLLRAEGRSLQRFAKEIRATAALRHPNLVTVYDSGIEGEHPYLVMELVKGKTVDRLAAEGMPPTQAAKVIADVARGLSYAHQQGLLHRDIKPQNMLVREGGEAVLLDFGLVRAIEPDVEDRITRSGTRLGTLPYMSPEQAFASDLDERSEVYALGASLYHALTGNFPFMECGDDLLVGIVNNDPVRPTSVRPMIPRDLEAICLRCMEKHARDRYSSAAALTADLQRFLDGEPTLARPLSPLGRVVRQLRRNRTAQIAIGSVALVAVLVAVGTGIVRSQRATIEEREQELARERAEDEERERAAAAAEEQTARELARVRQKKAERVHEILGRLESGQAVDLDQAVFDLVANGPEVAAPILAETVANLAGDMLRIESDAILAANHTPGQAPLPGLREAIQRRQRGEPLSARDLEALQAARLRARQSSIQNPRQVPPSFAAIMNTRYTARLSDSRLASAQVCCRALSQLKGEGAEALQAYLRAEWNPLRAIHPAEGLAALAPDRAFEPLLRASRRLGMRSSFSRRLAKTLIELAREHPPATASGRAEVARCLLSLGRLEEASAALDQAIALDPLVPGAHAIKARIHEEQGDLKLALEVVEEGLGEAREDVSLLAQAMEYRLHLGDGAGAAADGERAIRLDPTNVDALFMCAEVARKTGRYEIAFKLYTQLVEHDPYFAEAWAARAEVNAKLRRPSSADSDAKRALALDGGNAQGLFVQAMLLMGREDYESALEAATRAIAADPEMGKAYFLRGQVHTMHRSPELAESDFTTALKYIGLQHDRIPIIRSRGFSRFVLGDTQGALEDYNTVLATNPEDLDALKGRAEVFSVLKDYRSSLVDLKAIARLSPKEPHAWGALAENHYRLGNLPEGDRALEQGIDLDPNATSVLGALATSLSLRGRWEKSEQVWDKVISLRPQVPHGYYRRAAVRIKRGNLRGAADDLRRCEQIAPSSPTGRQSRRIREGIERQLRRGN